MNSYILPNETGKRMDRPAFFMYRFNFRVGSIGVDSARKLLASTVRRLVWIYETACSKIVNLEDSTSATARAVWRTILNGEPAHVQLDLLERLRIHLIGILYTEVGPEWSSGGKQKSDHLHHIDLRAIFYKSGHTAHYKM